MFNQRILDGRRWIELEISTPNDKPPEIFALGLVIMCTRPVGSGELGAPEWWPSGHDWYSHVYLTYFFVKPGEQGDGLFFEI